MLMNLPYKRHSNLHRGTERNDSFFLKHKKAFFFSKFENCQLQAYSPLILLCGEALLFIWIVSAPIITKMNQNQHWLLWQELTTFLTLLAKTGTQHSNIFIPKHTIPSSMTVLWTQCIILCGSTMSRIIHERCHNHLQHAQRTTFISEQKMIHFIHPAPPFLKFINIVGITFLISYMSEQGCSFFHQQMKMRSILVIQKERYVLNQVGTLGPITYTFDVTEYKRKHIISYILKDTAKKMHIQCCQSTSRPAHNLPVL